MSQLHSTKQCLCLLFFDAQLASGEGSRLLARAGAPLGGGVFVGWGMPLLPSRVSVMSGTRAKALA